MFGYMTDLGTVEEMTTESIEAEGPITHSPTTLCLNLWLYILLPFEYYHFASVFDTGHDMESLLFKFLDEFLFLFSAEPFFIPRVSSRVGVWGCGGVRVSLQRVKITEFNRDTFTIKAEGYEVACVFIITNVCTL